jgi:hypothetical protein
MNSFAQYKSLFAPDGRLFLGSMLRCAEMKIRDEEPVKGLLAESNTTRGSLQTFRQFGASHRLMHEGHS